MHEANKEVRERIRAARLRHWEVAEAAGIAACTLSIWLRTPLTPERRARIEAAIAELTGK